MNGLFAIGTTDYVTFMQKEKYANPRHTKEANILIGISLNKHLIAYIVSSVVTEYIFFILFGRGPI